MDVENPEKVDVVVWQRVVIARRIYPFTKMPIQKPLGPMRDVPGDG